MKDISTLEELVIYLHNLARVMKTPAVSKFLQEEAHIVTLKIKELKYSSAIGT